jgi:hypothetical protein
MVILVRRLEFEVNKIKGNREKVVCKGSENSLNT